MSLKEKSFKTLRFLAFSIGIIAAIIFLGNGTGVKSETSPSEFSNKIDAFI